MSTKETSADKTKYRLAEAAKKCMASSGTDAMKSASVEKITVTEIVETCGVTRQTFYRNFQDKYDLINWYFDKLLLESFAQMGDGLTVYEGLTRKFEFIQKERVFFAGAFRSDDHNSLREHDYELILDFYTQLIGRKTGRQPEENILFPLRLYCRGSIDMTVEWIFAPKERTPEQMAALLVSALPMPVTELFQQLGVLR